MSSYSIEAILRAVDQGFTSTMKAAQGQMESFSKYSQSMSDRVGKISDGMVSMGKSLSTYVTAPAVTAVGGIVKSFASLEQNLGGTQAVFGDFAQTVQRDAQVAYKNMGLSASDYMATANKMGSLFQGSGLEQQRALELTSQAMQRASDVASVMGIDMSMAMESITGAAKGNFTMINCQSAA